MKYKYGRYYMVVFGSHFTDRYGLKFFTCINPNKKKDFSESKNYFFVERSRKENERDQNHNVWKHSDWKKAYRNEMKYNNQEEAEHPCTLIQK